ncbi:hypothetical protein Vadar_026120 [Vaccinium darrowii]|uniref:Uncharacterized protein n=1 Tax=Vaccinium darrowii TaxID=229202 RepID=A0ACB7X4K6_9ERIC|nr:hypothetical protein Vadar_026120 [Vaccinium darrowii]
MAAQRNNYGKRSHAQTDYTGDGESKRNPSDDRDQNTIGLEDTVYRYLCPVRRIGSIIGKGGEIAKQLRAETQAKIRISETVPGCEERVVTIYSSSKETNDLEDTGKLVSPAEDALFRVHERVVADESLGGDDEFEESQQVMVRMLVPSDQIGCILGKGGQVIQNMRAETGAQIRVISGEHLPPCASNSDELVQISGEASVVRKALYQVASRLHDNPSRTQHLLLSSSSIYNSGGTFFSQSGSVMEFSLRLVCPTENIGGVIGKGGAIIKQIRQESGAFIKVDSSAAEGDDCIISISAKESFEDQSATIDAAMRLQPRCSTKVEKESGDSVITTRLLVPSSRIGCLIGKGGAIISEMRNATRATIRVLTNKESLPKVALEDEEMVQITGDLNVASNALLQMVQDMETVITNHVDGDILPTLMDMDLLTCLRVAVMEVMVVHRAVVEVGTDRMAFTLLILVVLGHLVVALLPMGNVMAIRLSDCTFLQLYL